MSLQPAEAGDVWSRFTVDPRVADRAQVRASDADRDVVAAVLADAYAEGRLDSTEYNERLEQAMTVKRVGEVVPLLSDIVVSRGHGAVAPADDVAVPATRRGDALGATIKAWVAVTLIVNLVWLFTSLSHGHPLYYWPMWPMLGTAIPVIMTLMFSGSDHPERDRRRAERGEQRRVERAERRRLGR